VLCSQNQARSHSSLGVAMEGGKVEGRERKSNKKRTGGDKESHSVGGVTRQNEFLHEGERGSIHYLNLERHE